MDEEKRAYQQAYMQQAHNRLTVSHDLFKLGHFDDAISRAYYAMFYMAKAALLTVDSIPHSHSGVVGEFSKHFVKTGLLSAEYSRMLGNAMQARLDSDYEVREVADKAHAHYILAEAERFVATVEQLLRP